MAEADSPGWPAMSSSTTHVEISTCVVLDLDEIGGCVTVCTCVLYCLWAYMYTEQMTRNRVLAAI